jgi:phosphomannomutase
MSASQVSTDSRGAVSRHLGHTLVDEEAEAVDQFVARILRRAHESAEARNTPSEARAILEVAHMFADEWIASDPDFDRLGFVEAATEGPS